MRPRSRIALALVTGVAIMPMVSIQSAGAQSTCAPASRALKKPHSTNDALLERRITLHGRGISLREALDRVAAAAHVRLSYSAEALVLTRPVCLEYESTPLSQILDDLLGDAAVSPVVLGGDQIVLTPVQEAASPNITAPIMQQIGMLDRVVVTGSAVGASQRALPVALDVVEGHELSLRRAGSLSGALDGVVPGLWLWEQSPLSMLARYGSIRGASSFGVSYPKVYVDGIEVANSLLVTHLDPESISRIEVIRGPQGAALYGADAISGVMNIITSQEGDEAGGARAQIQSEGGASSSDYSATSVLNQSHSVSLRVGNNVRSGRAGMTFTTTGPFIPGASSQQITGNAGLRIVHARGVVTGTFRLFAQDASTPANPLLGEPAIADSADRQSVRQYTVGASGTYAQNDRWTHHVVVGVDGYTLQSAPMLAGTFPSALDSALNAATGSAMRTTLRASSVGQFGDAAAAAATVTIAAEHSFVRDETATRNPFAGPSVIRDEQRVSLVESRSNAGIIGQISTSYRESFFLTGGLRIERNSSLTGIGEIATLPMLGASAVRTIGANTFKMRAAYGKGIRPSQTSSRAAALLGLNGTLDPEQQSGIEAGADAFLGKLVSVHVTRFDQRASGLIQPVSVYATTFDDALPRSRRMVYELQNVGEISNRGWELQGSLGDGPWSLGAMFSQVDSRVRKLASHYTGDLRPGDRMLEVPARTFGVNASYSRSMWSMSWRVSRASDWINYDRLGLLSALSGEQGSSQKLVGPELRSWWRTYDGVTRIGGRVGLRIDRGMTFTIDGENLLGDQLGEPDNITVLPGRALSAGLRVSF